VFLNFVCGTSASLDIVLNIVLNIKLVLDLSAWCALTVVDFFRDVLDAQPLFCGICMRYFIIVYV